jgi:predicted PhzF superfamily epimerase YddE/YHI9
MVGAIGAYPDGSGHAFEMRTFAPRVGVAEDPACGSMNASVGQWLTATGAAPSTGRARVGFPRTGAQEGAGLWSLRRSAAANAGRPRGDLVGRRTG